MKTLLERLKPENGVKLEGVRNSYPHTGRYIEEGLRNESYWFRLPYEMIIELASHFGIGYTPSDVANLFEKD